MYTCHCSIITHVPYLPSSGTTGYVVLSPQENSTLFENNVPAVFYCSGDGYVIGWYLNGSGYNAINAQMGITVVLATPTGNMVTSSLYIPSSSINNNTEVFCKVIDICFTNILTSGPADLIIQDENITIT